MPSINQVLRSVKRFFLSTCRLILALVVFAVTHEKLTGHVDQVFRSITEITLFKVIASFHVFAMGFFKVTPVCLETANNNESKKCTTHCPPNRTISVCLRN